MTDPHADLRAKAEAARDGWVDARDDVLFAQTRHGNPSLAFFGGGSVGRRERAEANTAFLLAASPTAILALLAENARLREALEKADHVACFFQSVIKSGEPWTAQCAAAFRAFKDAQAALTGGPDRS